MFCEKCGNEVQSDSKFCSKCGNKIRYGLPKGYYQMKCEECGGTMTVDESREIIMCPYCGSTHVYLESDDVKLERLKSDTEKYKQDVLRDIKQHEQDVHKDIKTKEYKNSFAATIAISIFLIFYFAMFGFMFFFG